MVNQQVLQGNWNQFKGKVREKWGQLTDSDLGAFHGNVDELVGTIQKMNGYGQASTMPPEEPSQGFNGLLHRFVSLIELQAQLLEADVREETRSHQTPGATERG